MVAYEHAHGAEICPLSAFLILDPDKIALEGGLLILDPHKPP
jgi:hypothetical protein